MGSVAESVAAKVRIFFLLSKFLDEIFSILPKFSTLHIHLHAIHLKDADITELADFVRVEEFHAASAFVEVVFEGDAAVPVLDGAVTCPEGEVDWFGSGEDFAEG